MSLTALARCHLSVKLFYLGRWDKKYISNEKRIRFMEQTQHREAVELSPPDKLYMKFNMLQTAAYIT